jgi:hypothetical protein
MCSVQLVYYIYLSKNSINSLTLLLKGRQITCYDWFLLINLDIVILLFSFLQASGAIISRAGERGILERQKIQSLLFLLLELTMPHKMLNLESE